MPELLNEQQIQQFITNGYVKIDGAFPPELAEECNGILWKDTGVSKVDQRMWTKPVIRLGDYSQESFRKVVNTPILHSAFNDLVGKGRWASRNSLGSFVIRFPCKDEPTDTGWHVDASFAGDDEGDFSSYCVNIYSKGRALLMLFLFSDVNELHAPTRIRKGSHLDVARILAPAGEKGLSFMELAQKLDALPSRVEVLAIGKTGTVYLCHPFIVHAAQAHRGQNPRIMAQPPLLPSTTINPFQADTGYSPVEIATRKGMGLIE